MPACPSVPGAAALACGMFRAATTSAPGQGGRLTLLEIVVVARRRRDSRRQWRAVARPGGAVRAAGAPALPLWARLEALWSGEAVAVVPARSPALRPAPGRRAVRVRGPGTERFDLARYARARVVQPLRAGIVWLPYGGARSCGGGGVISGRMLLADGRRRASVVVSSLGRVRVEVAR